MRNALITRWRTGAVIAALAVVCLVGGAVAGIRLGLPAPFGKTAADENPSVTKPAETPTPDPMLTATPTPTVSPTPTRTPVPTATPNGDFDGNGTVDKADLMYLLEHWHN